MAHDETTAEKKTREFESGATRDSEEGKLDYAGALSPLVLRRYVEYMLSHNTMADGSIRSCDDWQQGMPLGVYMKSLWRHFFDTWEWHCDPLNLAKTVIEDVLCGVIFNASGYLHEVLKEGRREAEKEHAGETLRKMTGERLLKDAPELKDWQLEDPAAVDVLNNPDLED